ncbi:MAG: T9SS type A sorting domain-containing protein [Lacinutrix sp.]|uniref:T9SS type A sorting domain-containing protein n=1 Tax=Lacinutrix sp. TaxID=1937692 RepID=UPI0030AD5E75
MGTNAQTNQENSPLIVELKENAVDEKLIFNVSFEKEDNLLVELYDSSGKFIKQLTREIIKNKNIEKVFKFYVKDLSSGIYYLDFHNNSGRQSKKFVKK